MRGSVPLRLQGKGLLLGGGANPFCEWDPSDGKERHVWGGPKGPVNALARLPSGQVLSAGNEGVLFVCSASGQQVTAWRAHDSGINAMATSGDGKWLLTAGADHTVKLHDLAKRTPLRTLAGHTGAVTSVLFGGDDWAASGGDDRMVILWDLKSGKKRYTLEGHAEGVNAVALSPRGDWLASASNDNTIRLWPLMDGRPDPDRESIVLDDHTKQVLCVAFSPDGKQLVSAGHDKTVKLWNVAAQKVVRHMEGHKNWVSAVTFHGPDLVLSASDDLTVRLWEAATGKELDRIDLATASDGPRSLLALGTDEFAVGTSGWVVMRFGLTAPKK
jgi:WD40 repeat protein